jgi:hypothetical protein
VQLVAGAVRALEVQLHAIAKDDDDVDLTVRATDRAGRETSVRDVEISSETGTITGLVVDDTSAHARVHLRRRDAPTEVKARLDDVEGRATLAPTTTAITRVVLGFGILGVAAPGELGIGGSASLLVRLPILDDNVHLGLNTALRLPPDGTGGVLVELSWRPVLFDTLTVHLAGEAGALVFRQGNVLSPGLALAGVVGAGLPAGPGIVELDVHVGALANNQFGAAAALLYRLHL